MKSKLYLVPDNVSAYNQDVEILDADWSGNDVVIVPMLDKFPSKMEVLFLDDEHSNNIGTNVYFRDGKLVSNLSFEQAVERDKERKRKRLDVLSPDSGGEKDSFVIYINPKRMTCVEILMKGTPHDENYHSIFHYTNNIGVYKQTYIENNELIEKDSHFNCRVYNCRYESQQILTDMVKETRRKKHPAQLIFFTTFIDVLNHLHDNDYPNPTKSTWHTPAIIYNWDGKCYNIYDLKIKDETAVQGYRCKAVFYPTSSCRMHFKEW